MHNPLYGLEKNEARTVYTSLLMVWEKKRGARGIHKPFDDLEKKRGASSLHKPFHGLEKIRRAWSTKAF